MDEDECSHGVPYSEECSKCTKDEIIYDSERDFGRYDQMQHSQAEIQRDLKR